MTIHIESQQLGHLEIPEDSVVDFPLGIPGFPHAHKFCLLEVKPGSRFMLLQCTTLANLAFVVTDPVAIDPNYPLDELRELAVEIGGLDAKEPLAIAAIVTVPPPPGTPTVNMVAPLIMGMQTRRGTQVILDSDRFLLRHAL
jgi:flagellar assembly factor FliW